MALYLTTGRIGSGKTLMTLVDVIKRRNESLIDGKKRYVYYSNNIRFNEDHPKFYEVSDWICLKPSDIRSIHLSPSQIELGDDVLVHPIVKPNSIIVIDEAHFLYPNRSTMAKVPPHVIFLSMLRHSGLDIYVITQKDTKLDPALRDDVKYHTHLTQLGSQKRSNYRTSDDGVLSKADPVATSPGTFPFPSDYFGLYHSATEHVDNKSFFQLLQSLPFAVKLLIPLGLFAVILVLVLLSSILFPEDESYSTLDLKQLDQVVSDSNLTSSFLPSLTDGNEKPPTIYINTFFKSSGFVLVTFSYVNQDKTQVTVSAQDLLLIGYDLREVREGVYTVNGRLITHAPVKSNNSKEKKNETN